MSFGQHRNFTSKFDIAIKKAIHRTEKKGKNRFVIENPDSYSGFDDEELVDQILHWKVLKEYRVKDEWKKYTNKQRTFLCKRINKIWQVTGIQPLVYDKNHETHDDSLGGTYNNGKLVKTPEKLIIELYKGKVGDYLPKKRTTIDHREFEEDVHRIGLGLLKEGRYCIEDDGDYGKIIKIYVKEVEDKELTSGNHKNNPHQVKILKDKIYVDYEYEDNFRIDIKQEEPVFDGKGISHIDDFMGEWQIIPEGNIKLFEERINHIEETGLLPFDDVLKLGDGSDESKGTASNALMGFDSQKYLQQQHNSMAVRKNDADIIKSSMNRKIQLKTEEVELMLAKKKADLVAVMSKLNDTIAIFKKEMSKIYRLITTLEIYMGVDEQVIQIAEGEPANKDTPISLRQMQLYMDEEFGEFKEGGLDHRNIEDFDAWLIDTKNFQKVVPEEKCVVIIRPRRHMKHYSDHPFVNAEMQKMDQLVYILIRNGNNLYRIWTDNIPMQHRLFPKKKELQSMMDEIHRLQLDREKAGSGHDYDDISDKLDEADDKMFYYKRNMLLLQGIIMRTPIFLPLPEGLNVMDIRTHKDHIKFIHDEEDILSDGRLRFKEWLLKINESIIKGSRIFFCGDPCPGPNNFKKRFSLQWYNDHSAPPLPNDGVYEVIMKREYTKDLVEDWIPVKEFEKAVKKWEDLCKPYKKESMNSQRYLHEIPLEDSRKYMLYEEASEYGSYRNDRRTRRTRKGVKEILINRYDPKTFERDRKYYVINKKFLKKDEHVKRLKISYNPKDDTYNMYTGESRERGTNITMTINPEEDNFIINYDALLLEDIEYYMENRIDRPNYLSMIPILRGLKKRLIDEKMQEEIFVNILAGNLKVEYEQLRNIDNEGEIETLVWEAVKWWKDTVVTVWKRPIAKDDKKAMDMITKRVKSLARKKFKVKLAIGVDNTKKVLCWRDPSFHRSMYAGFGLTKKQFIEQIALLLEFKFNSSFEKRYSKAGVGRDLFELKDGAAFDVAKEVKGTVILHKEEI